MSSDAQRRAVRERYGSIAAAAAVSDSGGCCTPSTDSAADESGCCSPPSAVSDVDEDDVNDDVVDDVGDDIDDAAGNLTETTRQLGYDDEALAAVEPGANLGLGCGNPTAIASLDPGDSVVDLGSGGGFDCFLAAREVGDAGRVIGVDMTPEMVERAREIAQKNDAENVEFRLGEIEHLPVADETVDVIISNCVINLSPDKPRVFAEAFRVLRPGGRLAISDVVLTAEPPASVRADVETVVACVGDAATVEAVETMLAEAGFADVWIEPKDESREFISEWSDERDLSEYAVSATIQARKPASTQQKQETGS